MKTLTATEARKNIHQLIQSLESSHEPVAIKTGAKVVVMIPESDWKVICEMLNCRCP